MTPMSDRALEMGCFCRTRLTAQPTETIAQTINRKVSMLENRHAKRGREQIEQSARKEERPGEMHELIVTEARQCATNPDVGKEQQTGLGTKPEERHEIGLQERDGKQDGGNQRDKRKHWERESIALARR